MPTPRWLFPIALLVVSATVVPACSGSDDPDPEAGGADPPPTTVANLCTSFPARDATVMLEAPNDTRLQGNDEFIDSFLEMGAKGLVEEAPPELKPAVETYVAALEGWEPGDDLTADPATSTAVEDINAWLAANCGPPTGSIPAASGPPGTPG